MGENNLVYLDGEVVEGAEYEFERSGERFFRIFVCVERLSGTVDVLPVIVPETLVKMGSVNVGKRLIAYGQVRTYNEKEGEKSRLKVSVFVREVLTEAQEEHTNLVRLRGYVCKAPVYRFTPSGREITEIVVAVNREFKKSDYVPCIVWGRNARFANDFAVGSKITLTGRLQSRWYQKVYEDGREEQRVAYEVSVSSISLEEPT